MSDLNQCTFTGRLGADPEIRRNQEGKPIANLRLAVSDAWRDRNSGERKEKTEWISITVFSEGLCKLVEQYLRKGSRVLIQGSWKTRKWTDQSGQDRYSTECVLQGFDAKLVMLDGPSGEKKQQREAEPARDERDMYGNSAADLMSDDIPFLMEWRG